MKKLKIASVMLAACALGTAAFPQAQAKDPAALAAKMNAMKGTDWRPGVGLGGELAALPGHQGYEILRDNWSKGAAVEPRMQMLKGWVFANHPDTLKVLNLAATDPDIALQNRAFEYLVGIAFQNFAEDYTGYKAWYQKYGDMPFAEVVKANAQILIDKILASSGKDRKRYYRLLGSAQISKAVDNRDAALKIVRDIVSDPNADQDAVRAATSLMSSAKPDEAFLKEVIVPTLDSKSMSLQDFGATQLGTVKEDWALDILLSKLKQRVVAGGGPEMWTYAQSIAAAGKARAIPDLIAVIDAHNGYETVYGIGYFGLTPLTGVNYDESHNGAWWRQWWEKNKERLPEPVRSMTIPTLGHAPSYVAPKSPQAKDPDPAKELVAALRNGKLQSMMKISEQAAKKKDYKAIPTMIGAIVAEGKKTIYDVGYFGLSPLTGVEYDETHDGAWWQAWWQKNKDRFPAQVRKMSIPKLAVKQVTVDAMVPNDDDVADIPSENRYADGNKDMRYLLAGPATEGKAPKEGYRLLVILPGGDGSADFHPFLKRVLRQSLPADFIIAQPVAKKWSDDQFEKIVWPTKTNPWASAKFCTEDFIEAVIADAKKHRKINPKAIYTMGWSSSGPPVYAHLLSANKSTAGAFIAMSIFQTGILPPVANVTGVPVSILHSPQDFIPIVQAETARDTLAKAGADVQYETYEGGHGWQGDVFGNIRNAVQHLIAPKK